ncbi:hypothetical protein NHX12_028585 [Muraenolepis orangiensis]|uniref:Uncharacterized protein n=1 Tax=Muraenolepis orangiensis TaxID=630683 RepID=A0A9Q0EAH5_9TELE|nr:hypothetical protein NHX12_028585 [Muraenolepis orangiensis]
MTMGSRKGPARTSLRAPKFLDKSGGFYGRLGEPVAASGAAVEDAEELRRDGVEASGPGAPAGEGFDANDGVTEGDDGETLLRVELGRRSGRWSSGRRSNSRRRSSGSKRKEAPGEGPVSGPRAPVMGTAGTSTSAEVPGVNEPMDAVVHLAACEDADDQVLIGDQKRGREEEQQEEGEEERRLKREQEEGMKALKRNSALDRALRRGWEAFVTNLYINGRYILPDLSDPGSGFLPSSGHTATDRLDGERATPTGQSGELPFTSVDPVRPA